MSEHPLLFFACIEIIVSLALAWLGVATMYLKLPPLPQVFRRPMYLIKSHIDFLLMALLLIAFHLIAVPLPGWIVVCAVIGSFTNSSLFLVLAVLEKPDFSPFKPLGMAGTISFLLTTASFGGAAMVVLLSL